MKIEVALSILDNFLSQAQNAKTIADIEKLHPQYEEARNFPAFFDGKSLNKVNTRLNNINKAIETALVGVISRFVQTLQATDSLENSKVLILDYHHIYTCSHSFEKVDMGKIEPLLIQMKEVFTQTLVRLTPQNPDEKETKDVPKKMARNIPKFRDGKINKARTLELLHVRKIITKLRKKAEGLMDNEQETPASQAANTLCDEIETYALEYEHDMIDLNTFKKQAQLAISISHDELDKPRGYCVKHILVNLAFAVLTLGVGYLIAAAYKGTFFPISPKTDSASKVDILELAVVNMVSAN